MEKVLFAEGITWKGLKREIQHMEETDNILNDQKRWGQGGSLISKNMAANDTFSPFLSVKILHVPHPVILSPPTPMKKSVTIKMKHTKFPSQHFRLKNNNKPQVIPSGKNLLSNIWSYKHTVN